MYIIKNLINTVTYPFRSKLKFSRPIEKINNENKEGILPSKEASKEEESLIKKYKLSSFRDNSSVVHYKENMYTLKLLEDTFKDVDFDWSKKDLNILDIGSKNFSYAVSLHAFFTQFHQKSSKNRTIHLDGVEIDPYRIMADLHSRYDYAQYYIRNLANTRYLPMNFLDLKEKRYDCITWFLPFVAKEPLISWGLPLKFYLPKRLAEHAYEILNHQGIIIIVNQTEREKNIQLKILHDLGLNYIEKKNPYTNVFSPYQFNRQITLIKKD